MTANYLTSKQEIELWEVFAKALEAKKPHTIGYFATIISDDGMMLMENLRQDPSKIAPAESMVDLVFRCKQSKHLEEFKLLAGQITLSAKGLKAGDDISLIAGALDRAKSVITGAVDSRGVVEEITGFQSATELLEEIQSILDRSSRGEKLGISSGIIEIDNAFGGGFRKHELILVGGRTGAGKTQFGVNCAYNAWRSGHRVLFISCEMPRTRILMRLLSRHANINNRLILSATLTNEDMNKVSDFTNLLNADDNLLIFDSIGDRLEDLSILIDHYCKAKPPIDMVIIDYAQYLKPKKRMRDTLENLQEVSTYIKNLTVKYPITTILLSQLNREAGDNPPELSHIRGNDSFAHDCDGCILLNPHKDKKSMEFRLRKMRYGEEGDHMVGIDLGTSKFFSLTEDAKASIKHERDKVKPQGTKFSSYGGRRHHGVD
jgi:replicative DNA helicase